MEQIRLAQFKWLSDPTKAIDLANHAIEIEGTTLSLNEREELIIQAIPLLVWRSPEETFVLADSIQNQRRRMEAFSWLAIFSFDANAADMLLSQRIANLALNTL